MGVCSKYSLTSFYGFWAKKLLTGLIPHPLAFLANSPSHQPPGQYPFSGPGGPAGLPGASFSLQPPPGPLAPPLSLWGFGPFRPPMASPAHSPYAVDRQILRPLFALNPMRPKGDKGATPNPKGQVGPKPLVDPPEPILAPNLISPKNGHKEPRIQIGNFQPLASGNHQRPPAQAQQAFPSIQGKDSPSPMYSVPRIQE
ncbi:hypothetical protein O181_071940 [Austropuccinia psidii MF-1]|uniref:Uncharacterized protein n=1 Tax=Austropuccinia psidii MF-1 TaxID=1389203 RepID=A0A9Q3IAI5_9BASI|nr:hypothetical protein [Austropuccinia psidii MF-1]